MSPSLISLCTAELFVFLVRNREIQVIFKKAKQRTVPERYQVEHGLVRSLILEFILFVPASVTLVYVVLRPFLENIFANILLVKSGDVRIAFYGVLGIVSYGFPFATIRRIITSVALNTLKNFAQIVIEHDPADGNKGSSKQSAVVD